MTPYEQGYYTFMKQAGITPLKAGLGATALAGAGLLGYGLASPDTLANQMRGAVGMDRHSRISDWSNNVSKAQLGQLNQMNINSAALGGY